MKPKKSLGQNFLIDKNILKKIVDSVNVEGENILEIGPGTGNLTNEIINKKPNTYLCIEKDKKLNDIIVKKFQDKKGFISINKDILKFDLENNINKKSIVFGNLPYNISTKILTNLIKFKIWPPKYKFLILMFQKEVAQRIYAKFNTKNYGRISILTRSRLNIINHFDISKNSFYPKPKVDSTLIIFEPKKINALNFNNIDNLEKITNIIFSNRRKMINKSLKRILPEKLINSELNDINLKLRPQELPESVYFRITSCYESAK